MEFYEEIREEYNNYETKIQGSIQDTVLHPDIEFYFSAPVTFENCFSIMKKVYSNPKVNNGVKVKILDYIYSLRMAATGNTNMEFKINIFEQIERRAYFDYPNFTSCLKELNQQCEAFRFVKSTKDVKAAMELRQ